MLLNEAVQEQRAELKHRLGSVSGFTAGSHSLNRSPTWAQPRGSSVPDRDQRAAAVLNHPSDCACVCVCVCSYPAAERGAVWGRRLALIEVQAWV